MRCANCDGFPCIVHAKSDAEVLGIRPALEHDNVELMIDAEAVAAEHRLSRDARSPAWWSSTPGRQETLTRRLRGRRLRRGELRAAAVDVGQRPPPERSGQRLRPGRAQLHVPQQPGGAGAVDGGEPDRLSEDPRAQRLLPQRARLRVSDGQHPDGRQVTGPDVPRGEAGRDEVCPDLVAGRRGQACGRFLAVDRGSPASRQPRDGRRQRHDHDRLRDDQRRSQAASVRPAEIDGRPPGHAPSPPLAAPRLPQERDPGRRRRPPGGDVSLWH